MLVFWLIIAAYKLFFSSKIAVASNRSGAGSSQPEPLSIEFADTKDQSAINAKAKPKAPQNAKKKTSIPMQPLDSPAMGTRSKKMAPASPAMSTRSKRRLSLWLIFFFLLCMCEQHVWLWSLISCNVWTTLMWMFLRTQMHMNLIYLGLMYMSSCISQRMHVSYYCAVVLWL